MQQLLLDVFTPPRPSLGNFLVGQNAQVIHAIREWVHAKPNAQFLYFWAGPGCGRTHLLKAAAAQLGIPVLNGRDRLVFKPVMKQLIVDDVHQLTPYSQVQLFNGFNSSIDGGLPRHILLTGDAHPSELKVREDLKTRILAGLCLRIAPLSDEEKAQALQNIAQSRGLELAEEVTDYALKNFQRDMGSLTAVLDGLDRFSLEQKKPVSLHLLKHWMRRRESLVIKDHETRSV